MKDYGVLLALAFLLGLFMFMLPMLAFPCMLVLARFVFAAPVLALVAVLFALPAVFELSVFEQLVQKTVAKTRSTKVVVRRI